MNNSVVKPWERLPGEPNNWYARFLIFRDMGPDRTKLGAVHLAEAEAVAEGRKKQSKRVSGAWNKAMVRWRWEERAAAYDKEQRELLERKLAEEKDHALNTGLGQIHERVKALKEMEELVKGEIIASSIAATSQENIDQEDGQDAQDEDSGKSRKCKKRRWQGISATLLEQWRGLLDDIAKEKGERMKKTELSGSADHPLVVTPQEGTITLNVRKLSDEQLDTLLAILEQSEAGDNEKGGGA